MAMLEIHGIHKSFGDAHILNGVDLNVNKGDVVVFESNVALKYMDGTVIPTTVIATVCGKRETVVVSFDDENVKLSGLEKTVPINIIKVIMKATEASIAKANQESSKTETEIDKDDIAEVLKAKFGSLEALAKTQGYADFIEYMKTIVDDDIDFILTFLNILKICAFY